MGTAVKQEFAVPSERLEPTESPTSSATYARAACTECSRRKQKCNREWPCNHCKKRKVGNQCRYIHDSPSGGTKATTAGPSLDPKRKRDRGEDEATSDVVEDDIVDYGGEGFEALGYSTAHLFARLTTRDETTIRKPASKQYYKDAASCPQLARALQALPPRPHTDSLVQNFLNNVNYHYYIIYAPDFLEEYQAWWKDRVAKKPLGLQWTCLMIMICACSCQYTDAELQHKLEEDLSESIQTLTERYHNAARELHSVIPVGHNHLLNVQQLLHSACWYKSEVRFVECWHVLAAAVREAQELGIHQESIAGPIPEFEREMRRRVWCILNTWDWQVSTLLGRPMIIDRSDCDIGLPSLSLEDFEPSPLLHMKLQSQLISKLARQFGMPKYVVTPQEVQNYQNMIESWIKTFPKWYDIENPDRSRDEKQPWMKLHRHYLNTIGYSMILDPIRPFLAKEMTKDSTAAELELRKDGISFSLRLMSALYAFFDHVYPRDSKFHFVIFAVFDTASVLCSTIIHDQDNSAPRKDDIFAAIDGAIAMLKQLTEATVSAKTSYQILLRISARAKAAAEVSGHSISTKRPKVMETRPVIQNAVNTQPMIPSPSHHQMASNNDLTHKHGHVSSMNTASYAYPASSGLTPAPYQQTSLPHPVNYSVPPNFVMQDFVPQASFAPHAPVTYAMDPLAGMATSRGYDHTSHGHQSYMPNDYSHLSQPFVPSNLDGMPHIDMSNITEEQMGEFAALWQYRSLNLDFNNPPP